VPDQQPRQPKRRIRYDDRMRLADYRIVFGSAEGKRVLYDLIARHYVLGTTFSGEQLTMAYCEGQRDVVLHILRYMQMTPRDIPGVRTGMLQQFELEDLDDDADAGRS
jgi:hypothetical protein